MGVDQGIRCPGIIRLAISKYLGSWFRTGC